MGGIAKGIGQLAATAVGGPLLGAAVGGGLGAIKQNQQKAAYNRQKELAARTAEYSPWTGMNAAQFMPQQAPSAFENIGGGIMGGALQGSQWAKNPMAGSSPMTAGSGQGANLFDFGVPKMNQSPWEAVPTFMGSAKQNTMIG